MVPLMKGSSWSSCRKMTRPFASSIRRGCTGLNACSGGMGIFFHGCAVAAGLGVVSGLAGALWALPPRVERRIGNSVTARRIVEGVFNVFWIFISHLRRSVLSALPVLSAWPGLCPVQLRELAVGVRRTLFARWFGC